MRIIRVRGLTVSQADLACTLPVFEMQRRMKRRRWMQRRGWDKWAIRREEREFLTPAWHDARRHLDDEC